MPPQPLSHVHPSLGYVVGGGSPFTPNMARAALSVIHHWSHIDDSYSSLIAKIAQGDPVTVTAVYHAMISGDARKAALIAAAKASLPTETASLIQATIEAAKASRDDRNNFAHGLWGSLNTRPDCVLLFRPKDTAIWRANFEQALMQEPRPELPPLIDRASIMVYKQKDFEEAEALAHARLSQIARLPFLVGAHPSAGHMRAKLLEDPQIARLHEKNLRGNTG